MGYAFKMRKAIFLLGLLIYAGGSSSSWGYNIEFKKIEGVDYRQVPAKKVQVLPIENYKSSTAQVEVGTLVLTFDPHEIGHDTKLLTHVVAQEAATFGAMTAYQLSVNFDTTTQEISGATYRCYRKVQVH
jgi:hypothetical protein